MEKGLDIVNQFETAFAENKILDDMTTLKVVLVLRKVAKADPWVVIVI